MTPTDLDAHVRRHADPDDGLGCARGCCWVGLAWAAVVMAMWLYGGRP